MRLHLIAAATAAAIMAFAGAANATTIDFSGYPDGQEVGATYASEGVVFTDAVFETCGGGCPTSDGSGNFAAPDFLDGNAFTAFFTAPQSQVSFQTVSNSSTLAQAFNSEGQLVASVSDDESFPVTDAVDYLTASDIASIVFSYNGGANEPAITNLTFATVSAAPEPATWALMFLGLGGIGLMMRRAKKTMGFRFKDALTA